MTATAYTPFTQAVITGGSGSRPAAVMTPVASPVTREVLVGGSHQAGTLVASQEAVDSLDNSVGATVAAYSQAILNCSGMSGPDQTAWTGLAQSYQTIHQALLNDEAGAGQYIPGFLPLRFGTYLDQLTAISQQLPTWRAKIVAACGSAPPLPAPPTPAPSPNPSTPDWAGTVQLVAVAIIVVAGVYFLAPIAMTALAFVPKPRRDQPVPRSRSAYARVTKTTWRDAMILDSVDMHHGFSPQSRERAHELIREGYIDASGTWKLTDKGKKYLEAHRSET